MMLKNVAQAIWADLPHLKAQINSAVLQKTSGVHKKQPVDISSMLSEFLYNNQNSRPIDFL